MCNPSCGMPARRVPASTAPGQTGGRAVRRFLTQHPRTPQVPCAHKRHGQAPGQRHASQAAAFRRGDEAVPVRPRDTALAVTKSTSPHSSAISSRRADPPPTQHTIGACVHLAPARPRSAVRTDRSRRAPPTLSAPAPIHRALHSLDHLGLRPPVSHPNAGLTFSRAQLPRARAVLVGGRQGCAGAALPHIPMAAVPRATMVRRFLRRIASCRSLASRTAKGIRSGILKSATPTIRFRVPSRRPNPGRPPWEKRCHIAWSQQV